MTIFTHAQVSMTVESKYGNFSIMRRIIHLREMGSRWNGQTKVFQVNPLCLQYTWN